MKVTTMACIQGAWLPDIAPKNILDIGAGTGLLSLMVAQKYNCEIDSVEIEHDAFDQLMGNITDSPWNQRINCIHHDIKDFAKNSVKKYDFIISNPPFYERQLKSANDKINHARHEAALTNRELIDICAQLIRGSGKISILLPPLEAKKIVEYSAGKSLYPIHQLAISDSEKKPPKAIVTILSKKQSATIVDKLVIKKPNGEYTSGFISLLNAYYLTL